MREPFSNFFYIVFGLLFGLPAGIFLGQVLGVLFNIRPLLLTLFLIVLFLTGSVYIGYQRRLAYKHLSEEERGRPQKPFSFYTYYLISVLFTFLLSVSTYDADFWGDINSYLEMLIYLGIFSIIPLIGYFRWQKHRGLTGERSLRYGLLSTPLGVWGQALFGEGAKTQINKDNNVMWWRKNVSVGVVAIIFFLIFLLFRLLRILYE